MTVFFYLVFFFSTLLFPRLERSQKASFLQFFSDQIQPLCVRRFHQMIMISRGGRAQHRGMTAGKGLREFPHILPGTDVHLRGYPSVNPVADADISSSAA